MKLKEIFIFVTVVILGLGLVIGSHFVFSPIKEAKVHQETLDKAVVHFPTATDFSKNKNVSIDGVDILLSLKITGDNEEALGYLYEAEALNSFGKIKVLMVVDTKERIISFEITDLDQTMYQTQTTNLAADYVGMKLSSNIPDGAAGATSISLNTLMDIVRSIGVHHDSVDKFDMPMPYKDYFGEDYVIASTTDTVKDGATVKIEVIEGKGLVYSLTKSGIYASHSSEEKPITLVVVLDNDGKVLGAELPADLYKHTNGYGDDAKEYALSFIDQMINDVPDLYAGSTDSDIAFNSRNLVHKLFVVAREVYQS